MMVTHDQGAHHNGPKAIYNGAPPANRTIFGSALNLFAMFVFKGPTIRGRGQKRSERIPNLHWEVA